MRLSVFHIILASIAICVLGAFAIPRISFDFFPKTQSNTIQIHYSYPLAHPRKVEETVTAPIESAIRLIDGINDITSKSRRGTGVIEANIDESSSIDFVRYEIATKLRELYPHLPDEVNFPRITVNSDTFDELETTLMSYSIYAKEDPATLYEYTQDQIAPQLAILEEWVLSYDQHKIDALGLSTNDIRSLITDQLSTSHLSYHYIQDELLYLRALPHDVTALKSLQIAIRDDHALSLGELIDIRLTEAIPRSHFRINGPLIICNSLLI